MILELSEKEANVVQSMLKREKQNIEQRLHTLQSIDVSKNKHVDELSILREKYSEINMVLIKFSNEQIN